MSAVPQQCIKVYHEVEKDFITFGAMMQNGEKLSNNINKGLFIVFERFISFFTKEIATIQKDNAHNLPKDFQALTEIAKSIIIDFGARERRKYMSAAYRNREGLQLSVNPKGFNHAISIAGGFIAGTVINKDLGKKIRNIIQSTMWDLLEVCDQSLLGLNSLIDVYRARIERKDLPEFSESKLRIKTEEKYTWGERIELSESVEEIKLTLTRKYFNTEFEARIVTKSKDLYLTLREHLHKLRTTNNVEEVKREFQAAKSKYMDAQKLD